ncbi:hypothetical protein KRMM14A1004_56980 [Krasilnikovia sp. MM14-A1004]
MHLPARPGWSCEDCGQPWPCGSKRVALSAEYHGERVSLLIYLAFHLADAIDDFSQPDRGPVQDLYARFLGWIPRPTNGSGGSNSGAPET